MLNLFYFIFILIFHFSAQGSELDQKLNQYVQKFKLHPIETPAGRNPHLYRLGKELFFETDLSGNRNISCATCHHPQNQGVDWLGPSLGEGASGMAFERRQLTSRPLNRSTPHIFNLGLPQMRIMFWDGRVIYNSQAKVFLTPLEIFNGPQPKRKDIVQVLTTAHAMQALFPILTADEMLGLPGSNELADLNDAELIIAAIEKRIFKGKYIQLMQKAWPQIPAKEWNIGHLLEAIAHFETHAFALTQTPWDRYLRGEKKALNPMAKRGALHFFEKGQCIRCHNGDALGGSMLQNIGVPTIGLPGHKIDRGLADSSGNANHNFMFKVPPLRNVAFTFPYMHNGTFFTLEQVVDHYNDVLSSVQNYNLLPMLNALFSKNYNSPIVLLQSSIPHEVLGYLSPRLPIERNRLSSQEKSELVEFLREGLSDTNWKMQ